MSQFRRSHSKHSQTAALGAREITSFDGWLANDNSAGGSGARPRRSGGLTLPRRLHDWKLPAAAFVCGLTAALVVSGLGDFFGIMG